MDWTHEEGIKNVRARFSDFSFPKKPITFGEEYIFPEDITNLLSPDLGTWMFKLAAWKGYALRLLSKIEIEESIIEDTYSSAISTNMVKINSDKKLNKDLMIGLVLESNPKLKQLKIVLIEKAAEVTSLKRLVEMYSLQLEIVSREITRRSLDLQLMQRGAILTHNK